MVSESEKSVIMESEFLQKYRRVQADERAKRMLEDIDGNKQLRERRIKEAIEEKAFEEAQKTYRF